jgi:S1-C subfamily serine protease
VTPGGPAAAAGLRVGDVVVAVDGRPIEDMAGLVRWLRPRQPGQVVEMAIERDGTPSIVAVTLGEASAAGAGD